jgi:hypothetical protein
MVVIVTRLGRRMLRFLVLGFVRRAAILGHERRERGYLEDEPSRRPQMKAMPEGCHRGWTPV